MDLRKMGPGTERAALLVLCLITLAFGVPYVQCLGDDTFIYMRVIENFLRSGTIEFNPGEPCYLVTSPTWFFLWANFTRVLQDIDLARYVLSVAFHLLAFLSTWLVARRLIRNPYLRLLTLAVAFLDPFYLRWMWAGWETGMKITMASLSLWVLLRLGRSSRNLTVFVSGLCIGFAFLTRPEMMVLVGLGLIYLIARFPGQRGRGLWYLAGVLLITVPWMLHAYFTFGWAVPHTVFAMSGSTVDAHYLRTQGFKFVQVVAGPLLVMLALLGISALVRMKHPRGAASGDAVAGRSWLDWLLVATWGASVTGYLITGSSIASIYTGLFIPGLALALAGAAERLSPTGAMQWLTFRKATVFLVLAVLVTVGIQSRLYYRYSLFNPQFRGGVDARFIDFATEIKDLTQPDDEVGLWELGVIGYFSERYIVDFAGLATPEIVSYMRRYDDDYAQRFVDDRGSMPAYMVAQYRKGDDEGTATAERVFFGVGYEPILSQKVQRIGGSRRQGDYDFYVLYRTLEPERSVPPRPAD